MYVAKFAKSSVRPKSKFIECKINHPMENLKHQSPLRCRLEMGPANANSTREADDSEQVGKRLQDRVIERYSRNETICRLPRVLENGAGRVVRLNGRSSRDLTGRASHVHANATESVEQALKLAEQARQKNNDSAEEAHLLTAIGLNRNASEAYTIYTDLLIRQTRYKEALITVNEAIRAGDRSDKSLSLLKRLDGSAEAKGVELEVYRNRIGSRLIPQADRKLGILIFTNLLPPQEMGGYGRTIWEFSDLLIQRGHSVKLLTADMPHLFKQPHNGYERVERLVSRELKLFGDWTNGRVWVEKDKAKIADICKHNYKRILDEVQAFQPDVCMAGNLDLLGHGFLEPILACNIPVIHRLGNRMPGYTWNSAPTSTLFCLCGCSQWINDQIKAQAFKIQNYAVLPPGAPLEAYYRAFSPGRDRLRICFAGLMLPYKGSQILMQALSCLKKRKVPFTCEFAGDTTAPDFVDSLKRFARQAGFENQVRFLGYLDRSKLSDMYARSNVLVFPSVFEEPFGKSIIEAQAAGLCVVCSGTGGTREIIEDNVNGLLFANGDPDDLADKLIKLQADKQRWAELSIRGQKTAFRYTTMNSVLKIESLFSGLLDNSRSF